MNFEGVGVDAKQQLAAACSKYVSINAGVIQLVPTTF